MTDTVTDRGLSRDKIERAVALSKEKYCSASIMPGATAPITSTLQVIDEPAPDPMSVT